MALSQTQLSQLSDALLEAEHSRVPIAPLTESYPTMRIEDAYHVQQLGIYAKRSLGQSVIGHKVGLTSKAMQQQLGVAEPDFGVITDAMLVEDHGFLDISELIAPKLEPEFAFRIDRPLSQNPSMAELHSAIGAVSIAIEVIDSRIEDWRIKLVDTVGDNASSARIVVGPWKTATETVMQDLLATSIELSEGSGVVAAGPGAAVLGDPIRALHWLANTIGRFGQRFQPGAIVLAGAVTGAVELTPGATYTATAQGFEPVNLTVSDHDSCSTKGQS